ncbi:flagellar hook-basal body complex protein FliE [uncultured Vagococcus sp.]|uniref:flagellar hook-basal body complex protein FliE n=1 Tax=uncultured Vagococcus sp. TaxID=189676 RepID=UPI0028CFED28|nr:flagellar hook-basal body complex protein FliE [uncultured Vagococcus sp.]
MDIATNYAQMLTDYQSQLKSVVSAESAPTSSELVGNKESFETIFTNTLDKLDTAMAKSNGNTTDLITGDLDNLHTMMIDMTEAQLTMQSAVQVRNKVVEAYNDVKNMQF